MGASMSSFGSASGQSAPSTTTTAAPQAAAASTTTANNTTQQPQLPPKTPSRRSRRVTKSDPALVNFKSNPRDPTPQTKHTPLTPTSRSIYASEKLTPARKSSRFTKFKLPKVVGAPKYSAKLSYEVGESVYCWGNKKLLYEAEVLERKGNKYKVHFVGSKNGSSNWYATDDMMGKDPKSNRYFREMWQRVQDEQMGRSRK